MAVQIINKEGLIKSLELIEFYGFAAERFKECGIPFNPSVEHMHLFVFNDLRHKLKSFKSNLSRIVSSISESAIFSQSNDNILFIKRSHDLIVSAILSGLDSLTCYKDIDEVFEFYPIEVFRNVNYKLPKLYMLELIDIRTPWIFDDVVSIIKQEMPHPSYETKRKVLERMMPHAYTLSS